MADELKQAMERREALKKELGLIDQYIDLHVRLFGAPPNDPAVSSEGDAQAPDDKAAAVTPRFSNDPGKVVAEAVDILMSTDWPLPRGKLLAALRSRGLEIRSKDPSKYLGTVLWRNPQHFINVEGEGYWLKDRPLPESLQNLDPLFR